MQARLLLVAALSLGWSGIAAAEPANLDAIAIPDGAAIQPGSEDPSAVNPKLDGALNQVASAFASRAATGALQRAAELNVPSRGGRVQLQIVADRENAVSIIESVRQVAGEVTGLSRDGRVLQAWISTESLAAVASLSAVKYLQQPNMAVSHVTSEALSLMNASAWHSAGAGGQDVKIGIIDVGFKDFLSVFTSELGWLTWTQNFVDGETSVQINTDGSSHGVSVAEIVQDVAP
jgi:hypothetical protein